MPEPGPYQTIQEIRQANKRAGGYFFDEKTMEYWGSTVYEGVYGGRYFVTSEQGRDDTSLSLHYTVRKCDDNGRVRTVGKFNHIGSLVAARAWAIGLADGTYTEDRFDHEDNEKGVL